MGNIGDQAMLESFLLNTTWPVTLLVEHEGGHDIPSKFAGRVEKIVLPDLFATRPWVRSRLRRHIAGLIGAHSTFSVIGADVMDGGYDAAQSSIRFGMLCIGNALGTPNRVLGFSWNGAPPSAVRQALTLSQPGSLLCSRDPRSLARLGRDGGLNLHQTADVVFAMDAVEPYAPAAPWIAAQDRRRIIIMNVSGLLASRGVRTEQYVAVARHFVRSGCSIMLLPHVIRPGDDDLAACAEVANEAGTGSYVHLVENLLRPSQVAWLAKQSSAVLTGRMHLSILALNQGVPAAVLSTQGKVSGLMDLFETPDMALEPGPDLAKDAMAALNQIIDDPSVRQRVSARLPKVRELALLNFDGLESD
ncbi:polysaccharide pyruvyl transferase family protein [Mycobacterium sp. DL592]|uniref:polysaccharide pyruvyl transferase family protein n=1 Tax=Mycobacterium sp. DL592 TaxID=2675524 RepID=UPI00141DAC79|nr:polysaccharide pyruvyl transferase family protein [Mycobacterium sp. DL592]